MCKPSNSSSSSRLCNPFKGCAKLIKVWQIFSTFLIFYIILLVLIVPLILLLLSRAIIRILFKLFFKGKYKLLNCDDATFATETSTNLSAFTLFTFVKGHCDIKLLRERLLEKCIHYTDKGAQPYLKLLHSLVIKYGFFCWHDVSNTFDICHHVKYFPSKGDFDRVYSESEIFDELSITGNNEWDCDKPKWEILVVPKVKLESSRNYKVCYVLILRFHPSYFDEISLVQFVRKCILDQQPQVDLVIDPINSSVPSQPLCFRILKYLQVFLLGPLVVMQNFSVKENNIFCKQVSSPTYFGRTTCKVTLGHIETLRKTLKCSTTSIFSYVFLSALRSLAELKGFTEEIPETIFAGVPIPLLPYPNDNLHNLHVVVFKPLRIGIDDTLERIQSVHETINGLKDFDNEYLLTTSLLFRRLIGLCPAKLIGQTSKKINCAFLLSNVPDLKGNARVNEFDVKTMFGCSPIINQFGFNVGLGCYNDKYTACFTAEKSTLIQNRYDLEILIAEFETQLEMLQNDSWYWQ